MQSLLKVFILSFLVGQAAALPVPRFVSLKADTVNFHVGPGLKYPTDWQYTRKSLPVEVIAEFGHWRLVKDFKGGQGWVHSSLLSGKRTVLIIDKTRQLRKRPDAKSPVTAAVEKGVICSVKKCQKNWCYVQVQDYAGWVPRTYIWGAYPNEMKF